MRFESVKMCRLVTAGCLSAACAAAPFACASADTSPQPGGVYPLKPGVYVAEGGNCAAPADAAIRHYDGKGIRTARTRDCRVAVREHQGVVFTVDQTCLDSDVGLGRRFVQRQVIGVRDALTFTQTVGQDRTTYRYCPVEELPAALRKAAD